MALGINTGKESDVGLAVRSRGGARGGGGGARRDLAKWGIARAAAAARLPELEAGTLGAPAALWLFPFRQSAGREIPGAASRR
jgi:hypothetical protein